MKKSLLRFSSLILFAGIDAVLVFLSISLSYSAYRVFGFGKQAFYEKVPFLTFSVVVALVTVLTMFGTKVYDKESSLLNVEEVKNVIKGATYSYLLVGFTSVMLKINISRLVLVMSFGAAVMALVVSKTAIYRVLYSLKPIKGFHRKILIYGAGDLGKALYRAIMNSPRLGLVPVGFIDDDPAKKNQVCRRSGFSSTESLRVLGTLEDAPGLIELHGIEEVYIAISAIRQDAFSRILRRLKEKEVRVSFVPNLYRFFLHKINLSVIGGIPLVEEEQEPQRIYPYAKRVIDVCSGAVLLVILSPLLLLIALVIRIDSPGSVLFAQERVGKGGKVFMIVKFRTMHADTDPYQVNPLDHRDARVTRVGRFLRRTSLDELPQLINVIKGEMSLVGPRPEMPFIAREYNELQKERLKVLPGITGLWQLSGDRKRAIHENMDYDLYYLKNVSFFLDSAILVKTLLFFSKGL